MFGIASNDWPGRRTIIRAVKAYESKGSILLEQTEFNRREYFRAGSFVRRMRRIELIKGIEVSQRLEQWAKLADCTLTSGSSTADGRPIFWSALGVTRLFIGRGEDDWLVITDFDRMESENFVLAASSIETIEKYLFGRFGMYIRSARGLPRVVVPVAANEAGPKFSIETRDYEGVERFALISPDGSPVAISSADKVTATAELKKLALYLTATIDEIEASAIDPDGKPLFERR